MESNSVISELPGMIESLCKIQREWELSLDQISHITHVDSRLLQKYFSLTAVEIEALPTIPAGLDSAVSLISIFRNLSRMIPSIEKQNEWLKSPNDLFEGNRPIEVMAMSPDHLMWVGYTLDSGRNA